MPHVLVVEDDTDILSSLVEVIRDEGYEVFSAANGYQALTEIANQPIDLIFLDLMMPVMDGWAFRSAQRQLTGAAAQVPVIVLSGAREVRARAAELGAVEALSKPFDLHLVVEAVARWVRPHPHGTE